MLTHCEQIGEFEVTEQRLADQARQIPISGWLSELELEEIKRKTIGPFSEELVVVKRLIELALEPARPRLPTLRAMPKHKLLSETTKNQFHHSKNIHTENITETNNLLYAASGVITERLGVKIGSKYEKRELMRKRRIKGQVHKLRLDLSRVESLAAGKILKTKVRDELQWRYKLSAKGYMTVCEELRQRRVVKANKLKRSESNRIE